MADPRVVREIRRQGRKQPRKYVKAAYATGIVESGLRNLPGGDADSAGWRQERASLYPNPTNVQASVRRFFREAKQHDRGQSAGQLAADVQRPAAQYRGRYAQVMDEAEKFLAGFTGSGSTSGSGSGTSRVQKSSFDKAGYDEASRRSVLGNLIAKRNPDSILLRFGIVGGQDPSPGDFISRTLQSVRHGNPGRGAGGGGRAAAAHGSGKFKITGPNPGRLKPYLVDFAEQVAGVYGKPLTGSDGTGHSYRTATGGVSQHSSGEATDIPASGAQLTRMGRAALIAAGMPRAQAMKQTGGLFNVNGHQIIFHDRAQVSGSPHDDHLHISAKPGRKRRK